MTFITDYFSKLQYGLYFNRLIFNLHQFVAKRTIVYNVVPFLLQGLRSQYNTDLHRIVLNKYSYIFSACHYCVVFTNAYLKILYCSTYRHANQLGLVGATVEWETKVLWIIASCYQCLRLTGIRNRLVLNLFYNRFRLNRFNNPLIFNRSL